MVNHFKNNQCITAKRGLCETLKNLIWFNNVNIDSFWPKCYHLNTIDDYHEFVEEFKTLKAESVLKKFVKKVAENKELDEKFKIKIQVALWINQKRIKTLDEILNGVRNHVFD